MQERIVHESSGPHDVCSWLCTSVEDPLGGEHSFSSILAWRAPWTEEHGDLQSVGLQRVGND